MASTLGKFPFDMSVGLESPAIQQDQVEIAAIETWGHVSAPFRYTFLLASDSYGAVDLEKAPGSDIAWLLASDGMGKGKAHGIIERVDIDQNDGLKALTYRVVMVPRLNRLKYNARLAFFVKKSVPDILREVLTRNHLTEGQDFAIRLSGTYPQRDLTVQYKETDFDFLHRLSEHWGISYFFEQKADASQECVVFSDDSSNWQVGLIPDIDFDNTGERVGIHNLRAKSHIVPSAIEIRDYDYADGAKGWCLTKPVPGGTGGTQVEYTPYVATSDQGHQLLQVRVEEAQAHGLVYSGDASVPALTAGSMIRLKNHPQWSDKQFLIIAGRLTARFTAYAYIDDTATPTYTIAFDAIPAERNYRPRQRTPKPRVDGVLPAVVVAEAENSAFAQIDNRGQYQVRLLLGDIQDQPDAYPVVRMGQPHIGPGYGHHFPLRPGTEVALAFVDGDIDRPFIMAAMPNVTTPSVIVDGNHMENVLRTGSGHEILVNDAHGTGFMRLTSPSPGSYLQMGKAVGQEKGGSGSGEDGTMTASDASFANVSKSVSAEVTQSAATIGSIWNAMFGWQVLVSGEKWAAAGWMTEGLEAIHETAETAMDTAKKYGDDPGETAEGIMATAGTVISTMVLAFHTYKLFANKKEVVSGWHEAAAQLQHAVATKYQVATVPVTALAPILPGSTGKISFPTIIFGESYAALRAEGPAVVTGTKTLISAEQEILLSAGEEEEFEHGTVVLAGNTVEGYAEADAGLTAKEHLKLRGATSVLIGSGAADTTQPMTSGALVAPASNVLFSSARIASVVSPNTNADNTDPPGEAGTSVDQTPTQWRLDVGPEGKIIASEEDVEISGFPTVTITYEGNTITVEEGQISLKADEKITVEAPDITLKGAVTVTETLTVNGPVTGKATIHANGNLTTGADVMCAMMKSGEPVV